MASLGELMAAPTFIALGVFIALIPHLKVCAAPYDAQKYYMVGGLIVLATAMGLTKKVTDTVKLTA